MFTFDAKGLCEVIDKWDRWSAPLVNRQRFRMMDNLITKGNRSSKNEQLASQWRERCAHFWSELFDEDSRPSKRGDPDHHQKIRMEWNKKAIV